MKFRVALGILILLSISVVQVHAQSAPQHARDHVYGPGGRVVVTIEPDNYPPNGPYYPSATLSGACANDGVDVAWDAATDIGSGVSGYALYRNGDWLTNTSGTSYHDSNVWGGASFTYAVAAYDVAGHYGEQASTEIYIELCDSSYFRQFRLQVARLGLYAKFGLSRRNLWDLTSRADDWPHIRFRATDFAVPFGTKSPDYFNKALLSKRAFLPPPSRQNRLIGGGGQ